MTLENVSAAAGASVAVLVFFAMLSAIVTIYLAWIQIVMTLQLFASGWLPMARAFPDRREARAALRLRRREVSVRRAKKWGVRLWVDLDVCPSGIRVSTARLFNPLARSFFIPWGGFAVARRPRTFRPADVQLTFGDPPVGRLGISPALEDRLARAAEGRWPSPSVPAWTARDRLRATYEAWTTVTIVLFAGALSVIVALATLRHASVETIAALSEAPSTIAALAFSAALGALPSAASAWYRHRP